MTPLVKKLVSFPADRFCALHLAGKRGTHLVFVGIHGHPNPLHTDTKLKAEEMRLKVADYVRTQRQQGNHVFLMGDLNVYATVDLDKNTPGQLLPSRYKLCFEELVTENFLTDTFRHRHPLLPGYTYSGTGNNRSFCSRLDYVCVDTASLNSIVGARIDYLHYSDHSGIAVAQLRMHDFWGGSLGHNLHPR